MILTKIKIKNVKSFKKTTTITLSKGLNVLIGPNSGGKSNLLEVIQGVFNDLFFEDIKIQDNEEKETKSTKPYKVEKRQINNQHLSQNILDKYEGDESEQRVSFHLLIEKNDIKNIKTLLRNKNELIAFEQNNTTSSLLNDFFNTFDFQKDYKSLIGKTIEVRVVNGGLVDFHRLTKNKTKLQFYTLLKHSRFLYRYIHFYNLINNQGVKFSQFLHYISPNRESVNLTNDSQMVDLNPTSGISTNQIATSGQTQDSRTGSWGVLLRILTENHCNKHLKENKLFNGLIERYLGINFSIKKIGAIFHSKYEVTFKRKEGSIKLSSGEKELLNIICAEFVHQLSHGILLIDEPELHLHRKWQSQLLNLLLDISSSNHTQLIIVTHSPHFIRGDMLSSLIRIYKDKGASKVALADTKTLGSAKQKDIFMFISASNNEKVFFADKVVLVEGNVDRIIFESIILDTQSLNQNDVIEVVEVFGKDNFIKFQSFLKAWKIKHFIIADNDYLSFVGSQKVKSFFNADINKIKKQIGKKNSKDIKSLLSCLLVVKNKTKSQLTKKEFDDIKNLSEHIASRYVSKKAGLSRQEKLLVKKNIDNLRKQHVYVLEKGEIEDYFISTSKFDIDNAIEIAKSIKKGKQKIPNEFETISKRIRNAK